MKRASHRPRLEIREAHCEACDSGRASRGVTSTPALGGVHVCEVCLRRMLAALVVAEETGRSGDDARLW